MGFEPTPFRTSALNWRLRPLGQFTTQTYLTLASITNNTHKNNNKLAKYTIPTHTQPSPSQHTHNPTHTYTAILSSTIHLVIILLACVAVSKN